MTVRTTLRAVFLLNAILAIVLTAVPATADGDPPPDRFRVSVGGHLVNYDTAVRLDSELLGRGTEIDLEDTLGLDDENLTLRIHGYWRPAPRHRVVFGYLRLNRDANFKIDRTIQFGDETFDINSDVRTGTTVQFYKASYAYSLLRREQLELAVSAGALVTRSELSIEVEGAVTGKREAVDYDFPIPVIGASLRYTPRPNIEFSTLLQAIKGTIGKRDGNVINANLTMNYFFANNWGLGFGFNHISWDYTLKERTRTLHAEADYNGLLLFVSYRR